MSYETIQVRFQEPICFIQFNRPEANNTINECMVEEFYDVLSKYGELSSVIVLEGLPEVFCFGADFQAIAEKIKAGEKVEHDPTPLYDLWVRLATGSFITISHVRGKANAGGVGFVAASDIVIADQTAQFSLSELLFGLFPACVLPFLIRKIGYQKAHYMSLMTQPIPVQQACSWGLVDVYDDRSDVILRKHLLRLKYLPKSGVTKYKRYINELKDSILEFRSLAIASNQDAFLDTNNLERIYQYVENGLFSRNN